MIPRNICPVCGSENPEGSIVCQVCNTNLQNLPNDVYAGDPIPVENVRESETDQAPAENEELDLDSPVPEWLQKRFRQKDKQGRTNFDFDSFSDVIFGAQPAAKPAKEPKTPRQRKPKKNENVYQPSLGGITEAPLVETEDSTESAEAKNIPALEDFKTLRPVKKWDDPDQKAKDDEVKRQSERVFQTTAVQMPLWWQQDAPLVEDDMPEEAVKSADEDDNAYFNSVSPTKVMDPETVSDDERLYTAAGTVFAQQAEGSAAVSDEYKPESGSLLSNLMNEINSNSVTPAPQENKARENGTVFYSGSHETVSEEQPPETSAPAQEEGISSAEALDQILREMGYQTQGEAVPAESVDTEMPVIVPAEENGAGDNSGTAAQNGTPEDQSVSAGNPDEYEVTNPDTKIPEKEDLLDELDIPWDLFESQDMPLPRSPEDQSVKTFSRAGLTSDQDSTTYQQRMMSSILEKIIYAENFVPAVKKINNRKISPLARLFWALAAISGVVMILMTGTADRITLPAVPETAEADAFYGFVEKADGDALVVLDYTPAYGAELDAAAENLLTTLEDTSDKVYLSTLNPAAMPRIRQILGSHGERIEFAGWWPAGPISIRSRLDEEIIPENIWLVTADSGSLRNWAEQLAAGGRKEHLHVLASGQLEPILKAYLDAGLVTSAVSRDTDFAQYRAEAEKPDRERMAVLYLTALVPAAWLCGVAAKYLGSEPNYGRKKNRKEGVPQIDPEKGAANDRKL